MEIKTFQIYEKLPEILTKDMFILPIDVNKFQKASVSIRMITLCVL